VSAVARSYEVIQSEIAKLQREAEAALVQERNEAIVRIRAEMTKYRISVDELTSAMPTQRKGALARTRGAAPKTKPVLVAAKKAVAAPRKKAVEAPVSAAEESPAVRLLQDAGIDFRRKRPEAAQASAPAQKVASKAAGAARSTPARKAGNAGAKAKATAAR
jgi:hypothetical protein